jgi:hypothetical protein
VELGMQTIKYCSHPKLQGHVQDYSNNNISSYSKVRDDLSKFKMIIIEMTQGSRKKKKVPPLIGGGGVKTGPLRKKELFLKLFFYFVAI